MTLGLSEQLLFYTYAAIIMYHRPLLITLYAKQEKLFGSTIRLNQLGIDNENDNMAIKNTVANWNAFYKMDTRYLQNVTFIKKFHMVEPNEVKMGSRIKMLPNKISENPFFAYTVPFILSLKNVLRLPEIIKLLDFERTNVRNRMSGSKMFDFEDDKYCKANPLFSTFALPFCLHTDEVEIVNPSGVNIKKHKLILFY